jgi:hypothetical protein
MWLRTCTSTLTFESNVVFPISLHSICRVASDLISSATVMNSSVTQSPRQDDYVWPGIVLAPVLDCHLQSGSGSELNNCQIGSPGRQSTGTVDSGTFQSASPYPSELGGSSAGPPAGSSVNTYTALTLST